MMKWSILQKYRIVLAPETEVRELTYDVFLWHQSACVLQRSVHFFSQSLRPMHGRVDWVFTSWKLRAYMTSQPRYHAYAAGDWHLLSPVSTQGANVLCNTFLLTMYIELGLCFQKNTHIIIVATLFKDMEWNTRQINTQHCLKSLQYNVYILKKVWNCFSMYHGVSAACMFIVNIHTFLYLSSTDKISEQREWFRVCHIKVARFLIEVLWLS